MPVFTAPAPTTELEAINTMLGSIGESPLPTGYDLTMPDQPTDIESAIRILRETLREALAMGWKFNVEESFPVAPAGQLIDTGGALNVFKQPEGALKWKTVRCRENREFDPVVRLSKVYQESGQYVPVLYDRTYHRDGYLASEVPVLYLDVTFTAPFEHTPESFRQYVAIRSARRFGQRVPGSPTLSSFQESDEHTALRSVMKDQGVLKQNPNLFDNPNVAAARGGREGHWRPYRIIRKAAP